MYNMCNILKNVIDRGEFLLPDIEQKIDRLWSESKISSSQRDELIAEARSKTNPGITVDLLYQAISSLEKRVKALEEGENDPSSAAPPEWVDGMVVYRGTRITFEGKVYRCIAPEGYPCSWAPYGANGYPPYWEVDEA